jgi:hypothetical protein
VVRAYRLLAATSTVPTRTKFSIGTVRVDVRSIDSPHFGRWGALGRSQSAEIDAMTRNGDEYTAALEEGR